MGCAITGLKFFFFFGKSFDRSALFGLEAFAKQILPAVPRLTDFRSSKSGAVGASRSQEQAPIRSILRFRHESENDCHDSELQNTTFRNKRNT
jgi:hypothetical protein